MTALTILQIILKSLELSIKLYDNMGPEQKKNFAERHDKRMEFWEKLFDRFDKEEKSKPAPTP